MTMPSEEAGMQAAEAIYDEVDPARGYDGCDSYPTMGRMAEIIQPFIDRAIETAKNSKIDSLAKRCFSAHLAEDELFDAINKILGCDVNADGTEPWPVGDTWTDWYDCSVEVARPDGQTPMTPEQASKILDLGFSVIYESIGQKGRRITRSGAGECSPREPRENRHLCAVKTRCGELRRALETYGQHDTSCPIRLMDCIDGDGNVCDCGFDATLAALAQPKGDCDGK